MVASTVGKSSMISHIPRIITPRKSEYLRPVSTITATLALRRMLSTFWALPYDVIQIAPFQKSHRDDMRKSLLIDSRVNSRRLALRARTSDVSEPQGGSVQLMTAKGKARLARALAIRKIALSFMRKHGRWARLTNGPEVIKYEDPAFLIIVSIQQPVPPELRKKFNLGPLAQGLYCLDIGEKGVGKVLNLTWNSVGAPPRIVTFRRGDWEGVFVPPRPPRQSLGLFGRFFASPVSRQRPNSEN
jgi:hypothetical protein